MNRVFMAHIAKAGLPPTWSLVYGTERVHEMAVVLFKELSSAPSDLSWGGKGQMAQVVNAVVDVEVSQINVNEIDEWTRHFPTLEVSLKTWARERQAARAYRTRESAQ